MDGADVVVLDEHLDERLPVDVVLFVLDAVEHVVVGCQLGPVVERRQGRPPRRASRRTAGRATRSAPSSPDRGTGSPQSAARRPACRRARRPSCARGTRCAWRCRGRAASAPADAGTRSTPSAPRRRAHQKPPGVGAFEGHVVALARNHLRAADERGRRSSNSVRRCSISNTAGSKYHDGGKPVAADLRVA